MNTRDFISRLKHAKSRPSEAINRLTSRTILRLLGIDLSLETEIQYIELGTFHSQITRKELVTDNRFVAFLKENRDFQHNFVPRYLVEITDVIVNTATNHIYVLDSKLEQRYLIRESTNWPVQLEIINNVLPRNLPKTTIKKATLGIPKSGYFHWVTEDLPNLLRARDSNEVLCFKKNSKTIFDLYEQLNIDTHLAEKWIYVEKLYFYTKGQDLGYLHPTDVQILQQFAEEKSIQDFEKKLKIYVSRKNSRRSLPLEEELENYLASRGFQIMYAENHSVNDQIRIFSDATLIVGVHGAGLTNSVWSSKCKLIEIMPRDRINRCFEWQANVCGQQYERVLYDEQNFSIDSIISELKHLID